MAVTFPLRLTLHHLSSPPRSRPMAAALAPYQSRELQAVPPAGYEPHLSLVSGRVA